MNELKRAPQGPTKIRGELQAYIQKIEADVLFVVKEIPTIMLYKLVEEMVVN